MDKVLCPYCGREMKVEELLPFSGDCAYTCECGGLRRRRPLQKPLTLDEACGSEEPCVYFEDRDFGEISAASVDIGFTHGDIRYRSIDVIGGYINKEESAYGKTWRCWATKPTQAEREAAKWE